MVKLLWTSASLLSVIIVLPFLEFYISGIILFVSDFFHLNDNLEIYPDCKLVMYIFLLLSNISLYGYTVICPFIVGILVYFQFLVIISQSSFVSIIKASVSTCVQILVWKYIFICRIAVSYGRCASVRNCFPKWLY